jgi:heme/copper-type cytochrome/quinol oxidase subunit 3
MSHDVAHAHHEHPDVVGSRNRLGVVLLLVADISFAISVLFVYFYLKQQNVNDMWLPRAKGQEPGVEPVSSMTAWYICAMVGVGLLLH